MGFFGNLFSQKQEVRSVEREQIEGTYTPAFAPLNAFGNSTAMSISAVYRATEIISDTIAILPIKVKMKDGSHKDDFDSHSINYVFKNGIEKINRYNFIKLLVQSVILKGNGFAYIERGADGTVTGLRYLQNGDVVINYNRQLNKLNYTCSLVSRKPIEPQDMIHLVKNSYDGVNGVSVLSYAKRIIDTANSTENTANSFFSNGCNVTGVLTSPKILRKEQKEQIRTSWTTQALNKGVYGSMLGILDDGMTYQPIQINSRDAQMLETRQFNVQDIARFFGISPVLLGDLSHTNYSTIEAMQQQFLLHTLQPYLIMIEEEFTKKLFKDGESNLEINLDESVILRTDKTAQANYYSTLLDKGILSVNEVRKELGYSEIEGGDAHTIAYTDIKQNQLDTKEEKEEKVEEDGEGKDRNKKDR